MDELPRILALYDSGQLAEAETACAALLAQTPENGAGWALRGAVALKQNRFADAVDYLERASAFEPNDLGLLANLGMALYGAGRIPDAVNAFKNVLKRDPTNATAFLYVGRCRLATGLLSEAAGALNAALTLRPEWPEALDDFARLSLAINRPDKALAMARRALAMEPGRLPSLEVAGYACEQCGDYEAAAAYFREAVAAHPDGTTVRNLAASLQRMGRHEDAVSAYAQARESAPDDPALRHGEGSSLLALGRLGEGWPLYAARFDIGANAESARTAGTRLERPPKAGMRVAAWADQGVGEQILFAGLIPDLARTGADVAVECDFRLAPLLARSFPDITVCAHTTPAAPALAGFADGRFCLSDAASWFRGSFADFSKHSGYLKPDRRLVDELKHKYSAGRAGRPLIGISWRRADGAVMSDAKSLPLAHWGPLLHVAGATFVNLQYGDTAAEVAAAAGDFGVRIISDGSIDPLINLDAFAAQVAAMDLVISTSSTTAHMAGALNVPVWTFLPVGIGSLWHWFLARDDSPWYPSMRLFRQSQRGDWEAVLDAASAALVDFVEHWPGDAPAKSDPMSQKL